MSAPITGGCLCGGVRYEVRGPFLRANHCHCSRCRRHTGTVCGSSLFGGSWPDGDEVTIRLGSVDGDPGIRPQFHTFVASKAIWDEIADDLPQYPEWKND